MKYETKEKFFNAKKALISFTGMLFIFALIFGVLQIFMLIFKDRFFEQFAYSFKFSEIEITLYPESGVPLPSQSILNAKFYYTLIIRALKCLMWAGFFGYAHKTLKAMNDDPYFSKNLSKRFRTLARFIFVFGLLLLLSDGIANDYFYKAFDLNTLLCDTVYVANYDYEIPTLNCSYTFLETSSLSLYLIISCLLELFSVLLLHGEELQEQSDKLL
ncbi:MAG: hypothetical protein IKM32_07755 [Clostridia bacterium]|nr:hypothetical protein [Clostridia bacterium]